MFLYVKKKKKKVLPRFELGLQESESRVITSYTKGPDFDDDKTQYNIKNLLSNGNAQFIHVFLYLIISPLLCACRLCSYSGHLWSRYPCISPCGSANGHRLMVYRVLTYACFAFVIKYIPIPYCY